MLQENGEKLCHYCVTYNRIISEYPVNVAIYDEFDDDTPRCELHYQFKCGICENNRHFNGISFCQSCLSFTCLYCTSAVMTQEKFLCYDYHYSIPCFNCDNQNPALDYAEYVLKHPFQTGYIRPSSQITLWVPISENYPTNNSIGVGFERINSLARNKSFVKIEEVNENLSREIWNNLGHTWAEGVITGDHHHTYLIIPEMMKLMNLSKEDRVLDLACGTGNITRLLKNLVKSIQGIDNSEVMLSYAIKEEKAKPMGIEYYHISADKITSIFNLESFDHIISNMALMDMDNISEVIKGVFLLLKTGGKFTFSITHPEFAWPTTNTIKLPHDSERNEDKAIYLLDYFDMRPTKIQMGKMPGPWLYFHRPISYYVNQLIESGFTITKMIETKASDEIVAKYPRTFYIDHTKLSNFLLIQAKK